MEEEGHPVGGSLFSTVANIALTTVANVAIVLDALCWGIMAFSQHSAAVREWHNPGFWRSHGGLLFLLFIAIGFILSIVAPIWLISRRKPRWALACAGGLFVLLMSGIWLSVSIYGT